jgi:SAM-dependent methyltransferase
MSRIGRKLVVGLFGDPFILRSYQRGDIEQALTNGGAIAHVLDVGAGELGLTCWLKRRHPDWAITACDFDFSDSARGLAQATGVSLISIDGVALPLRPGGYDRVLLSSVLQMVPEPAQLLQLCHGALNPATGRLVLTVPAEYHFLSRLCQSRRAGAAALRRFFGLPDNLAELQAALKRRFGVQGSKGCYATAELVALLASCGFQVKEARRTPGWLGTLAWEVSLLCSLRWGAKMYALMGVFYPLVWLAARVPRASRAGEHLVNAFPSVQPAQLPHQAAEIAIKPTVSSP